MPVQLENGFGFLDLRTASQIINVIMMAINAWGIWADLKPALDAKEWGALKITDAISSGWAGMCLIMNFSMVWALAYKITNWIRAWVWLSILAMHVHCFLTFARSFAARKTEQAMFAGYIVFINLLRLSFLIYCSMVVNSYHTTLVLEEYAIYLNEQRVPTREKTTDNSNPRRDLEQYLKNRKSDRDSKLISTIH